MAAHARVVERDAQGNAVRMIGHHEDLTARLAAEEERTRLFTMSADMICTADINTCTFLKVNPSFERVLGHSEQTLLSRPFPDFIHPDDLEPTRLVVEEQLQRGEPVLSFVNRYRCADGSYRWLDWNSSPDHKRGRTYAIARDITERKREEEALRRFEWLNDKEQPKPGPIADEYAPPYGDLTALNTCRVIADAVDKEAMASMGRDLMDLLDTSVAVYEKNGDYVYGSFDSAWCRLLDSASFALCKASDTREALGCGKWLCHENCWNDSARAAMAAGQPTDIECVGGIRLYAAPVLAADEVVGCINIGYGAPPSDEESLRALAERFERPFEEIRRAAQQYKPRPRFIVDVAKRRCRTVAQMIGDAVQKSRLEAQLAQADRLSSMGTLAAGVAHEINNPLAYTLYNLETVVEDLPNLFSAYRNMMASPSSTAQMGDSNGVPRVRFKSARGLARSCSGSAGRRTADTLHRPNAGDLRSR